MTRIDVDGVGFTQASTLLADANRWAAVHAAALSNALADTAAMAGDSSYATDFATAYDRAAATVTTAVDDAVTALATLARLVHASYDNHRRAELSSIATTITVSTQPDPTQDTLYATESPTPPPSLGGDSGGIPGWAAVILDHIEGFVWPDADTERLRATATDWRTAAGNLDDLTTYTARAINALFTERSPEIFLATDTVADCGSTIGALADICTELAATLESYATAVESHRETILDLVRDLLRDAVLISAAGFVVGFFTAGGSNAVATWLNAGKLSAEIPKFRAILETLRAAAAIQATNTAATTSAALAIRLRLERFRLFTPTIEVHASTASVTLAKSPAAGAMTFLGRHEGGGVNAHTLSQHVGKSDEFLRRRLALEPKKAEVSTFSSEAVAESSIKKLLAERSADITAWLKVTHGKGLPIEAGAGEVIGRVMTRSGEVVPATTVRMILLADPKMDEGFRILTAYVKR